MRTLFAWVWSAMRGAAGLLLPGADTVRRTSGPVVLWGLRLLLLVVLVAVLFFLNKFLVGDTEGQRGPWVTHPLLAQFFLPVLGLLLLGWAWLLWYLYKLFTEPGDSDFPDIDKAWREARDELKASGVDLEKMPIFLILGRPSGGETTLLDAAMKPTHRSFRVRRVPVRGPIRVYATEDAVYVTCVGASVSGKHAQLLARHAAARTVTLAPAAVEEPPPDSRDGNLFKTMAGGEHFKAVQKLLQQVGGRDLTPEEEGQMSRYLRGGQMGFAAPELPSLVRSETELQEDATRLEYFCRLLAQERRPNVPVQGLLLLVPWDGAASDDIAALTADAFRRDLAAARAALRVSYPTFALVTDLEEAAGFRELIGGFKTEQRRRERVGRSHTLHPELKPGQTLEELVSDGLAWLCNTDLPARIYQQFALEQNGESAAAVTSRNVHLYQVLAQLQDRYPRLARILAPVVREQPGEPCLFGGCYLAATGRDPDREQAFIAAVVYRLLEERERASWTDQAVAEDARQKRVAVMGYAAAGVVALALLVLAFRGW